MFSVVKEILAIKNAISSLAKDVASVAAMVSPESLNGLLDAHEAKLIAKAKEQKKRMSIELGGDNDQAKQHQRPSEIKISNHFFYKWLPGMDEITSTAPWVKAIKPSVIIPETGTDRTKLQKAISDAYSGKRERADEVSTLKRINKFFVNQEAATSPNDDAAKPEIELDLIRQIAELENEKTLLSQYNFELNIRNGRLGIDLAEERKQCYSILSDNKKLQEEIVWLKEQVKKYI